MTNPQLLIAVGILLIAAGLFASIGVFACPVLVGIIALVYAIAIQN